VVDRREIMTEADETYIDVGDIVAYHPRNQGIGATEDLFVADAIPGDTGEVLSRHFMGGEGPFVVVRRWRDGTAFGVMEEDLRLVAKKPREGGVTWAGLEGEKHD
jgi:hypothetical protein